MHVMSPENCAGVIVTLEFDNVRNMNYLRRKGDKNENWSIRKKRNSLTKLMQLEDNGAVSRDFTKKLSENTDRRNR